MTIPRQLSASLIELAFYLVVTLAAPLVVERELLGEIAGYLRSGPAVEPSVVAS